MYICMYVYIGIYLDMYMCMCICICFVIFMCRCRRRCRCGCPGGRRWQRRGRYLGESHLSVVPLSGMRGLVWDIGQQEIRHFHRPVQETRRRDN